MSEPVVRIDLDLLLSATAGTLVHAAATSFSGAAIDGRAVLPGGLFFAIRGERFDGHDFAAQAAAHGAAGLVLSRGTAAALPASVRSTTTVIEVDDTVRALGDLARAHRLGFPALAVAGITGSNGKTTTKELLAAILVAAAGDAAVHKTAGNFNNHLGLPLTLLRLHAGHRYAVIEMGMSALGEIAYLAALARPDVGVVTNVGPVHLEALGSLENVARAKGELFAALPSTGVAIYPDTDARLEAEAKRSPAARLLRFGAGPEAAVQVLSATVGASGTACALRLPGGEIVEATLAALGIHNATNAAAAAAAALALGIDAAAIARGLSAARGEKHRTALVDIGGRRVIDDCYNASPPSTAAALDTLVKLARPGGHRAVAVLGDMLELGEGETGFHRGIGERAARLDVDALVTLGERGRHIGEGARDAGLDSSRIHHAGTPDEAAALAAGIAGAGDYILVKASRGARLERVLESLAHLVHPTTPDAASQQGAG